MAANSDGEVVATEDKTLAASCLTEMAEIIEMILQRIPGKFLSSAGQVCHMWSETVRRIRRKRKRCFASILPVTLCKTFSEDIALFIKTVIPIEVRAVVVFSCGQFTGADSLKKVLSSMYRNLPKNCLLAGGTNCETFGSNRHYCHEIEIKGNRNVCTMCLYAHSIEREWLIKHHSNLGIMLIPRNPNLQISSFHVPLRNKYKSICGLASFLPDMKLPVKLVLMFAHPLSLGKLSRFAVTCKTKYSSDAVIVGAYSSDFIFCQSSVTHHEIAGLVFSGSIAAASVLIPEGRNSIEREDNKLAALDRLAKANLPLDNAMALMFLPVSKFPGPALDAEREQFIQLFQKRFANVPVLCCCGPAAYGCDTVQLRMDGACAGGRDFLQRDATVLCLFSIL